MLRNLQLNREIQELGFLCFWGTQIKDMKFPQQVKKIPEQLGFCQKNPEVVRLPDGLETVGNGWFQEKDVEKS